MSIAIELAKQAEANGEVPVGAVLILDDKMIGKGRNQSIEINDPSAHAEIQALREGGSKIGNYRVKWFENLCQFMQKPARVGVFQLPRS